MADIVTELSARYLSTNNSQQFYKKIRYIVSSNENLSRLIRLSQHGNLGLLYEGMKHIGWLDSNPMLIIQQLEFFDTEI